MATAVLAIRLVLASVFLVAALGKFLDRPGSRNALVGFGVPSGVASVVAPVLPVAEFAVSVALVLKPTAQWAAIAAAVLMLVFVGGIANMVARGLRPGCHCFGVFHSEPAGPRALARNSALLGLAVFAAIAGPGPSVPAWFSHRTAAELVATALGLVAVALGVVIWRLRKDRSRLQTSLAEAEAVIGALPPGLPVGALAPDFALAEAHGGTLTLKSLLERRRPVLLVFLGLGCRPSGLMVPDLARWQATLSDSITIAVISRATPEHNDYAMRLGVSDLGLQDQFETILDYRVYGTPSAVLVSPQGRIASSMAQSESAIEALVRLTLRGRPLVPAALGNASALPVA